MVVVPLVLGAWLVGGQDPDPVPVETPQKVLVPPKTHGGFFSFAFSPDAKLLAGGTGKIILLDGGKETGAMGGELVLWEVQTGKLKGIVGSHGETVDWVAWSRDGKTLASASCEKGLLKIWDAPSGKLRRTIDLKGEVVCMGAGFRKMLLLSPDGRSVVSVHSGKSTAKSKRPEFTTLTVWNLQNGSARWSLTDMNVDAIALSPDGNILAGRGIKIESNTVTFDPDINLWETQTGKTQGKFPSPVERREVELDFLPDGKTLGIMDSAYLVLAEVPGGKETLRHPWREAYDRSFLAGDGKTVALKRMDHVDLYDVKTGTSKGRLVRNLMTLGFSRDFRFMAANQPMAFNQGPTIWDLSGLK